MKQTEVIKKTQELLDMRLNDKINHYLIGYDGNKIERKDVWDLEEKSLLIHSILTDRIIPQIYVYVENDVYYIIDGSKRISAILDFIQNKFAITGNCYDNSGSSLRDKAFYSLSQKLQHKIMNYKVKIIEQSGTAEEAIDTFIRCNNGVPVKPIEIFRAKMGNQLSLLKEICNHNIFALIQLGVKDTFRNYEMALYFLMLESNPGLGMAKKEKEEFVRQISNTKSINSKIRNSIISKLDYLFKSFNNHDYNDLPNIEKYLKKSHIIILYKIVGLAIEKKISEDDFFKWANDFFYENKNTRNTYWIESSRGSTTAKSSIDIRFEELKYNFEAYFSDYNYGLYVVK